MSDEARDRVQGFADEQKGKAKEAFGDLRGDEDQQAEGEVDQAKGQAKQTIADVKDKIGDAAKKLTQ